ncbi:hypothetical protein KEM56_006572 [Ascosphaera pollenicola]|nr:hypothetical protein KEM56_006572 [Ascosphaera pollenicola]
MGNLAMDPNSWLMAAHAEDLTYVPGNPGYDVLSAQNAFPFEFGLCDYSPSSFDFEQQKRTNMQPLKQPTTSQLFDGGLPLTQSQDTGSFIGSSIYPSETVFSPLSGTFSDSIPPNPLSSPHGDSSFNNVWNAVRETDFAPGRKNSMDTLISDWGWSQADTSSLPELTPSSPENIEPNIMPMPAQPRLQGDCSTHSPTNDASLSRVIRIETDRRFSDAGYIPPVSHSSAVATERVLSLLGCLQPVVPRNNQPMWPLQQDIQPNSFMQQELAMVPALAAEAPSRKRKADNTMSVSAQPESYQPNKKREYLDYYSLCENPHTEQRMPSVETTQTTSEMSETQTASSGPTYTKRRRRLTESERKRNRVLSEKQRREELKGRLDEICSMIPGLHSNLGTKSLVLQQVADWLENLILENTALQSYLNGLTCC